MTCMIDDGFFPSNWFIMNSRSSDRIQWTRFYAWTVIQLPIFYWSGVI